MRSGFVGSALEFRNYLCRRFEYKVGKLLLVHVEFRRRQYARTELWEQCGMNREATYGHRLLMRFPLRVVFRYALEGAARISYFRIEVEEKYFGDVHRFSIHRSQIRY